MNYISAKEISGIWKISRRRVQVLCEQGRVRGAYKVGAVWVIPKDAEKPADQRSIKKNGKEYK